MKVHRDHYEGTKYDLTEGLASGPFGSPVRYDKGEETTIGYFERPIGLFRTDHSYINVSHKTLPYTYFAHTAPSTSP